MIFYKFIQKIFDTMKKDAIINIEIEKGDIQNEE